VSRRWRALSGSVGVGWIWVGLGGSLAEGCLGGGVVLSVGPAHLESPKRNERFAFSALFFSIGMMGYSWRTRVYVVL